VGQAAAAAAWQQHGAQGWLGALQEWCEGAPAGAVLLLLLLLLPSCCQLDGVIFCHCQHAKLT
jgi:hypothetical protein